MTEPTDTSTETQAALDAGIALAKPNDLDGSGRFFSVVVPAGAEHEVIDIEEHLDKFRDAPRRKVGTYAVHDAGSFVAYLKKHGRGENLTEIWADITRRSITAVIDAHGPAGFIDLATGWGQHRLQLRLQHTPAWTAWVDLNRRALSQKQLAEHFEDRRLDIVSPDSATMLELTRTFKAKANVEYESGTHLSTGQTQLVYRETVDAKSGRKGDIAIPESFQLALAPFEGGKTYKVEARLRYAITDGALRLTYVLDQPEEVLRTAFADVLFDIDKDTDAPVFQGVPV
jgi:uncharacterized protein YfdQ (DUF2303 family)